MRSCACLFAHVFTVRVCVCMWRMYINMPAYMTCSCARVYVSKVEESDVEIERAVLLSVT